MTLEIKLNKQEISGLLSGPPKISDPLESATRVLDLEVSTTTDLRNYLGQAVELWYGGKLWFYGFLFKRSYTERKNAGYVVYDPCFFMSKNSDDFYIKNMTATQGFRTLAERTGVTLGKLANTKAVFKALYYQGKLPDEIAADLIARTYQATGKKYWYRFNPDLNNFGLTLFERKIPAKVWAFQVGVNLTAASLEESIEDAVTRVKLVERETGKTVVKTKDFLPHKAPDFGKMTYFEEVSKDDAAGMEQKAKEYLNKLAKIKTDMSIEGVNPNRVIPQLFSADVIYAEERNTKILGAYHIKNISQTFRSKNLVEISADIQRAPGIPEIKVEDATKDPNKQD